jgi:hypothetical protein
VVLAALGWPGTGVVAAEAGDLFRQRVVPFVRTYCADCHNADHAEAQLNLVRYESAEMAAADYRQWEHVATFLEREEMPPEAAQRQPSPDEREEVLRVLREALAAEARKLAGDPGVVLPRRLSNAEYDHSIRDLTGVDIRPTASFPVDPAGGEGFNNTGEALSMSPALFGKLYAAAQHVADHALLTTTGLKFAPYPVATYADRSAYCEQEILQFYERHRVDCARYLTACWQFHHRPPERRSLSIEDWADECGASPRYLRALYQALEGAAAGDAYYLLWLRQRWQQLPPPADSVAPTVSGETRAAIEQLASDIAGMSRLLCPQETEAIVSHAGNGPIDHLARRRKTAAERDTFDAQAIRPQRRLQVAFANLDQRTTLRIAVAVSPLTNAEPPTEGVVILKSLNFTTVAPDQYQPGDAPGNLPLHKLLAEHAPEQLAALPFGRHPLGETVAAGDLVLTAPGSWVIEVPVAALGGASEIRLFADAELDGRHTPGGALAVSLAEAAEGDAPTAAPTVMLVDPDHRARHDVAASGAAFCRLFPNRFCYVDETRGLSAGFHLIEGFFRDDQPLYRHVLSDAERGEIDRLWTELEYATGITEKLLRGFVFFERSERNFLKHPDFDAIQESAPDLVSEATLANLEQLYLKHSGVDAGAEDLSAHPICIFFDQIRRGLAQHREQQLRAAPLYERDLEAFARAAWRRPLSEQELAGQREFFQQVAAQSELELEEAVRATLIRTLVSPHFGCRIDPTPAGDTVAPLDDLALASRLSYFLWSSLPDQELLDLAAAGRLHEDETLRAQTRRLLQDSRVLDFAREFCGQWLGYRDFLEQESIDRSLFPEFDESLRQAMFEEPTRLMAHLIQANQPVTALLDSDVTFVNERLARHYGLPFSGRAEDWQAAAGLHQQGRSGILGMAVFLARNSQPQRTSPVKRGFWVVHKVLGEHIPAPPADVVALPAKETDTDGKTIRELLALHVADAKCARCHVRFDAIGLSMEAFDPIGRLRTHDLAGRAVDDVVHLPDGGESRGVPEMARYLAAQRRDDFLRTLCRKLLGYALGRSLQLSDDMLLAEMRAALDAHEGRIQPLLETIVLSPQFRNRRCRDFSPDRFTAQNQGDGR